MSETGLPLQPELVTPRLRLRRVRPADAALIGLYASDAKIARMTTSIPHPYPPGLAEAFVARMRAPAATETLWVLDTGADGENGLIGAIVMRRRGERGGDRLLGGARVLGRGLRRRGGGGGGRRTRRRRA